MNKFNYIESGHNWQGALKEFNGHIFSHDGLVYKYKGAEKPVQTKCKSYYKYFLKLSNTELTARTLDKLEWCYIDPEEIIGACFVNGGINV